MMEHLFVYGTLQDPQVQEKLIGRRLSGIADSLQGYQINNLLMPPYPVAMPADDSIVEGQLLEITEAELHKLDEYEGECYLRIRVWLQSSQETWVYIGDPACYPDEDLLK